MVNVAFQLSGFFKSNTMGFNRAFNSAADNDITSQNLAINLGALTDFQCNAADVSMYGAGNFNLSPGYKISMHYKIWS
jgi:hypothetical protein